MVRAIPRANLMTSAKHSRDADGVLVCLGAAVCEEEGVDVARCDLGKLHAQARAHLGCHEWVGIGKDCGLILNSANDALVAVPYVDAHQLAIEVDEPLLVRRPEVNP